MSEPQTPAIQKPASGDSDFSLASVGDLISRLPKSWHGAKIAIGWTDESSFAVKQLSFHENGDGKKVVVLHSKPMKVDR